MARKELIICDTCGNEIKYQKERKEYDVIFTTEQTEGRGVKPYFTKEKLDLCDVCKKKLENWHTQIEGHGAMGYNKYKLVQMSLRSE